ncbi:MAG TPA: DUF1499 domain-containing protein [Stellaceae bacterium]|nr:DUF1499 domain-containing protein [Stellaceae bacterium]
MTVGLLIVLLAVAAAGVALRLFMDRAAENRLFPGEDIAIHALRSPLPENGFLACPEGYCAVADAMRSPVYPVDAARLYQEWTRLVASEPRVVVLAAEPAVRRLVVIQRSALFRFPDIVIAEFVAVDSDHSSLAVYSHARYGRADFGVNRKRVECWLALLQSAVAQ